MTKTDRDDRSLLLPKVASASCITLQVSILAIMLVHIGSDALLNNLLSVITCSSWVKMFCTC